MLKINVYHGYDHQQIKKLARAEYLAARNKNHITQVYYFPEIRLHPDQQIVNFAKQITNWKKLDKTVVDEMDVVISICTMSDVYSMVLSNAVEQAELKPENVAMFWDDIIIPIKYDGEFVRKWPCGWFDYRTDLLLSDIKLEGLLESSLTPKL